MLEPPTWKRVLGLLLLLVQHSTWLLQLIETVLAIGPGVLQPVKLHLLGLGP